RSGGTMSSLTARPTASALVYPNRASAPLLQYSTSPSRLVAITASGDSSSSSLPKSVFTDAPGRDSKAQEMRRWRHRIDGAENEYFKTFRGHGLLRVYLEPVLEAGRTAVPHERRRKTGLDHRWRVAGTTPDYPRPRRVPGIGRLV